MYTRREFGLLTLSSLTLPALSLAQTINGVRLGVQTYSLRELPRPAGGDMVEPLITGMKACGFTECELWAPQIEPASPFGRGTGHRLNRTSRRARICRRWRIETPLDHFQAIRKKFESAGIRIWAYNYSPDVRFSDDEINRGFEIAKALGAEIITASATLESAKKIAPFAEKHRMVVAMHNHSNTKDPNEFATPESFAAAKTLSKYFKVNLDIGHFTAANYDAVAFLNAHHADVTNLHIKDRKKNQGDNVAMGHGRHADSRGPAVAEAREVADSRLRGVRAPRNRRRRR